jgi:hypothetical protein
MLLAISDILQLKLAPTLRIFINILYFIPNFFYLAVFYSFPEVLEGVVPEEFTCIFGLGESCWMAVRLGSIINQVSPVILMALW